MSRTAGTARHASIAVAMDDACAAVLEARAAGRPVSRLRVHPDVYAAIAGSRARETARGNPILVLDLDLSGDATLPPDAVRVD